MCIATLYASHIHAHGCQGRAVPGKHYIETKGVVTFEKGKEIASFQIEVVDDDGWEPIRCAC